MKEDFSDLIGEPGEFDKLTVQSRAPLQYASNIALEVLTDPEKLTTFLNATRSAPFTGIDSLAVSEGYAAAVWMYRQAALSGDYKTTKALQLWIEWANMVQSRPEHSAEEPIVNPNTKNFLPRDTE